jgi:hypothetical protein
MNGLCYGARYPKLLPGNLSTLPGLRPAAVATPVAIGTVQETRESLIAR